MIKILNENGDQIEIASDSDKVISLGIIVADKLWIHRPEMEYAEEITKEEADKRRMQSTGL